MKFNDKYGIQKNVFESHACLSFGEVEWTGRLYPCHNWPCKVLTSWVAYIQGEGQVYSTHVCSEECLEEARGGCPVIISDVQTAVSLEAINEVLEKHQTILVANDSPAAPAIVKALEDAGHEVVVAEPPARMLTQEDLDESFKSARACDQIISINRPEKDLTPPKISDTVSKDRSNAAKPIAVMDARMMAIMAGFKK